MKENLARRAIGLMSSLVIVLCYGFAPGWSEATTQEEMVVETLEVMQASGAFEVKLSPLETYTQGDDTKIGRMSIDKTFTGDLVGTSQGEMLTGGAPAEGSAGYVAIERVRGVLQGRRGGFLLQHSATMTPESQTSSITVVPASGTGELEGIAGTMSIEIKDGQHFYKFEYTLPRP